MKTTPAVALVAATLVLAGCGQTITEAACNDTVDALADALERCGLDGGLARDALEDEVESSATMGQGCGRVVRIRNERDLRQVCLPALETLACDAIERGALPAECRAQLEVRVR